MLPSVKPVGGEEAYAAQRDLRFDYSPPSRANYQLYLKRFQGSCNEFICDYLPWKYQLEPNSSCNLSCTFCAVSTWSEQKGLLTCLSVCSKQ